MRFLMVVFALALAACASPPRAPHSDLVAESRSGAAGAPVIAFIPGLTAPGASWDAVRPAFEGEYDVRVFELAGMGGAPARTYEGGYLPAVADALAARLKDARDVTLVGHSMGGTLALMVAQRAPQAIGRIVVVDQVPFLAPWLSAGRANSAEAAAAMAAQARVRMTAAPWSLTVDALRATLPIQSRDPALHPQIEAWMRASDQRTAADAYAELLALDLRPALPTIAAPTLVLMSYDEGFTPLPREAYLAAAQAQYAGKPNVTVRLIEGSRHFIQLDQPAALIAAIASPAP